MNEIKISSDVTLKFTPQGISYILDLLATAPLPWKNTNPLIGDIMAQLKAQEGGGDGQT